MEKQISFSETCWSSLFVRSVFLDSNLFPFLYCGFFWQRERERESESPMGLVGWDGVGVPPVSNHKTHYTLYINIQYHKNCVGQILTIIKFKQRSSGPDIFQQNINTSMHNSFIFLLSGIWCFDAYSWMYRIIVAIGSLRVWLRHLESPCQGLTSRSYI